MGWVWGDIKVQVHWFLVGSGFDFVEIIDSDIDIQKIDLSTSILDNPFELASNEVIYIVAETIPGSWVASIMPDAESIVDEPLVQNEVLAVFFE